MNKGYASVKYEGKGDKRLPGARILEYVKTLMKEGRNFTLIFIGGKATILWGDKK